MINKPIQIKISPYPMPKECSYMATDLWQGIGLLVKRQIGDELRTPIWKCMEVNIYWSLNEVREWDLFK